MLGHLKKLYEIDAPKIFLINPLNTDDKIRAVVYQCACMSISEKLKEIVLFLPRCPRHDRAIAGYWKHLSLNKRKLRRISYIK